jgi:Na+-translocating ferredoxin:NAD+ oxidoreductase subunit B
VATLAERIDAALPQTQCTRCGYPDCRSYAQAVARHEAGIDQCPPGGAQGIERLAAITGLPARPLNPRHGVEGPLRVALIDETWCIGCTLCIKACPVDCILGAPKAMHTVASEDCTGCELCIPACPVDCISLVDTTPGRSGWDAWSEPQALRARKAYDARSQRLARLAEERRARDEQALEAKQRDVAAATLPAPANEVDRRRRVIEAALARARAKRGAEPGPR